MKKETKLNFQNVTLLFANFVVLAIFYCFASAFFISKGYSNTSIGLILSITNIGALFLSPVIADYADTSKRFSLTQILIILTIVLIISIVPLYLIDHKSIVLSACFIIAMIILNSTQPLYNTVGFKMEEFGVKSNYGFARAFGSMSYALTGAVVGNIIDAKGGNYMAVCGFTASLFLLLIIMWTNKTFKTCSSSTETKKEDKEPVKLLDFIKNNTDIFFLCIAYSFILFSPNIIENFLLQIITPLGGTAKDSGYLTFMWAMLELPTMFAFNWIKTKVKVEKLLIISGAAYLLKTFLMYIATSMTLVYIALSLQWCSFALYCPAMVEYINNKVNKGEEVRGQALNATCNSIFMIFESAINGYLLDKLGPKPLLLVGVIATSFGFVLLNIVIRKIDSKSKA